MDALVSVSELSANLGNPDWRVFDCRFSLADGQAGAKAYSDSHIPGALYINLEQDLSTPHIPGETGRHPLPEKGQWIATVQNLGLNPDSQVVIYDDAGGAMAARLWWMLRWVGHNNVAVLNGGWQAWQLADLPVTAEQPLPPDKSEYDYNALPSLVKLVTADDIDADKQLLLDARELPRFRGEVEPLDPVAGHIPGALCSPFSANLDSERRFRNQQQLQDKFKEAKATDKPVVCYCGSGVTAAHNILAMKIAGLDEPALYPGSWSEWITDTARPVATSDEA